MNQHLNFLRNLVLLLGTCAASTGCHPGVPPMPKAGPPTVTVSYPLQRQVTDYAEFPGQTAAVDSVDVRARVSGYIKQVNFQDGADVKKGDVLYEIDPRPYEDALNQAKAQVSLQEAQVKYYQAVYQRNLKIEKGGPAVAVEQVEQSLEQLNTSKAQVAAAEATEKQAELNLNWTKVRAPISGRLGRTLVTPGNLIVADTTVLTTIVSEDPMYAYFDVDEPTVLKVRQLIREGKYKSAREPGVHVPVYLGLSNEQDFPHQGYLDFINNQVNPSTGTLQLRGVFSNPKPPVGPRLLSPGFYVRIRVAVSAPYQAMLVTLAAIGTNQNIKYVYVVNDENRVVQHEVTLGAQQGQLQVIKKGLKPDERVIVNGLQHVRPGMEVQPVLEPMPIPAETGPQPVTPLPSTRENSSHVRQVLH
jgi:RND family efflux transporter MFP subunit